MKPPRKSSSNDCGPHSASTDPRWQKINSLKLINLVRSQEVLYNSDAEGYSDKNIKDVAWERIYRSMFPKYETLSDNIQKIISANVRRRWKTLRNAIAREVKKNATVENYIRKKESPVIAELEFLIPHIKSAHCARLADALGLRDSYSTINETDELEYDEDYNDTVDLTEEQLDIKPFNIKQQQHYNEVPIGSTTVVPHEALYPNVQLNTDEENPLNSMNGNHGNRNDSTKSNSAWRNIDSVVAAATTAANNSQYHASAAGTNSNWRGEYCAVVQCKEGEFMNSTLLCTNPESEENHEDAMSIIPVQGQGQGTTRQTKMPSPIFAAKKRPRPSGSEVAANGNEHSNGEMNGQTDSTTTDVQTKIMRLLTNLERRENRDARADQDAHDEDRMFLLSLVSDMKRVPPAKKMLLKAEIAMAIAKAVP